MDNYEYASILEHNATTYMENNKIIDAGTALLDAIIAYHMADNNDNNNIICDAIRRCEAKYLVLREYYNKTQPSHDFDIHCGHHHGKLIDKIIIKGRDVHIC
jgi:hypothetical protein